MTDYFISKCEGCDNDLHGPGHRDNFKLYTIICTFCGSINRMMFMDHEKEEGK